MTNHSTIALIVAAGRGIRFAQRDKHHATSPRPKQYSWFGERPLLTHCLDIFLGNAHVDAVAVVINQQDKKFYEEVLAHHHHHKKILPFVIGGDDRQDSVYRGLQSLEKYSPDKILIHDAARPFFSTKLLDGVIEKLSSSGAAIPAIAVTGALKEVADDKIIANHSRQNKFIAQTPQGFDYKKILLAHKEQQGKGLDDDAAVWQLTYPENQAVMVAGDVANIKITTRDDMELLKYIIDGKGSKAAASAIFAASHTTSNTSSTPISTSHTASNTSSTPISTSHTTSNTSSTPISTTSTTSNTSSTPISTTSTASNTSSTAPTTTPTTSSPITTLGVDFHRFADEETQDASIMLGGVAVVAKKNILAHSDGDVILHAITDAMLGALGAGDIGVHFPPSEEKWRGVASRIFVEKAMTMMKEKNAKLLHVDITLLLEEPKVNSYREGIVKNLGDLLGLPESAIGFKATTTEKMGIIGAGEGIMAMAQLTISLPSS